MISQDESPSLRDLRAKNEALRSRLAKSEDTLKAIYNGGTEAFFVGGKVDALIEERTTELKSLSEQLRQSNHEAFSMMENAFAACRQAEQANILLQQEIAERKQTELTLRASHERLRQFFDANIIGIIVSDAAGNLTEANDYFLRLIGYTREQFQPGRINWRDFTPTEWLPMTTKAIAETSEQRFCTPYEKEYFRCDGTRVPILITHAPLPGPEEHCAAFVLDLSALKRADRRIREQAELLDKANEAIVVTDPNDMITFWSLGAERVFGWASSEMIGRPVHEVFAHGGVTNEANICSALTREVDWRGEINIRRKNGDPIVIETGITVLRDPQGRYTGRLGISSDITDKKRIEEKFLRAQRLDSIGMLASGIAHDLNNMLAPIGLATSLLRPRLSATNDLRLIDTLEKCATRGAGLVRHILGFVHGVGTEPTIVQVEHLLRDITLVITETFPKSISLCEEVPNNLWPILANPTQIHQVLLNLCVNARDAMPNGGTLTVRAENCVLDPNAAAAIDGARPGAWLVLHVEDTGTGIPPDVIARIWEPFFTTKPPSKGTGLGLSTVRGIIETCHGFITLETGLGRGTCFRLYLPAAQSDIAADDSSHTYSSKRGRRELILLVDDEEFIRYLASATLTDAGYQVITASDGVEAVGAFEANAAEIALVITDLDMPKMGGETLVGIIRTLNPYLKILAMSGGRTRPAGFASAFVEKPFTAETLLTHVGKLLHSGSTIT